MLKIETVPIGMIKPNTRNPRKNAEAVEPVARSIAAYGFLNPLIVDEDYNLLPVTPGSRQPSASA